MKKAEQMSENNPDLPGLMRLLIASAQVQTAGIGLYLLFALMLLQKPLTPP